MVLLYLLMTFHPHKCAPLKHKRIKEYRTVGFEQPSKSKFFAEGSTLSKRKSMRITFDTTPITSGFDTNQCTFEGQSITWEGTTATCSSDDLLNQSKIDAVTKTLSNVKAYLESILSVDRLSESFQIRQQPGVVWTKTEKAVDTDFYVIVVTRPYEAGSTILAQAESTLWTNSGKIDRPNVDFSITRPIQGSVYLNSGQIPLEAQDYNSSNREFFGTVFHEMIHALGVTDSDYEDWYNPDTGNPYGKDFPLKKYTSKKWGTSKVYNLLTTPSAHRYAAEFFGAEEFEEGVPAGIEIEDGGGGGTALSHPEARVYHDDFFVGFSVAPSRFTSVALALLNDTGFYDVDFSRAEPTAWLNNEAVGTEKNVSWALGPPQLTWPDYYLCKPEEVGYEQCSYDLMSGAGCRGFKQDCTNATEELDKQFCSIRNFADPLKLNMMGPQETHDFTFYKSPYENVHCTDTHMNSNKMTTWNGETYGGESMCALSTLYKGYVGFYAQPHGACYRMTCEDDKLAIYVEGDKHYCDHEGQKLIYIGFAGTIRCPDPARACRVRKLYGVQTEVTNLVPKYIGLTMKQLASILIALLCVIIALVLFFSIRRTCLKWKLEKQYEEMLRAKAQGLDTDEDEHHHHHHSHHHHHKNEHLDDLEAYKQQKIAQQRAAPAVANSDSDDIETKSSGRAARRQAILDSDYSSA